MGPCKSAKNSNGGKLTAICSDLFFRFKPESDEDVPYDLIFDKDSLGALDYSLHPKYFELLNTRLKQGGYWYIEAIHRCDADMKKGPPFHISESYLKSQLPNYDLIETFKNHYGEVNKDVHNADRMGYLFK